MLVKIKKNKAATTTKTFSKTLKINPRLGKNSKLCIILTTSSIPITLTLSLWES